MLRGFKALKQIVKLQYKLEDHAGMMTSYRCRIAVAYWLNGTNQHSSALAYKQATAY